MKIRKLRQLVPSTLASDGAGVTLRRSIGTPALPNLDPFLMLDQFGSDDPDDYIAGFPDHPHRGFITVTYMLDGHMLHQDSMGNRGDLRSGGVQWMKAASGVIHSEMPQQEHGLMRGFQLWLNLPAREKMSDPAYQEFAADRIPVIAQPGQRVKVVSGAFGNERESVRGPIEDPNTNVVYLDVSLAPHQTFTTEVDSDANAFVYVFEGAAAVAGDSVPPHHLAVLGNGATAVITSAQENARFILVAGSPIGEPVAHYGPFVMNTRAEIMTAMDDFKRGRLVRKKASMSTA